VLHLALNLAASDRHKWGRWRRHEVPPIVLRLPHRYRNLARVEQNPKPPKLEII
jgi:hypothetical protein